MSKFLKHVGKHGDRKVAVIFRQLPGEEHMALVVYTELLNQNIHDPLISAIEGDRAQNGMDLSDALNTSYTRDGKVILQVLHREGMLKKVNSEHITMTPAPNQSIKLSELNTLLNEMSQGENAVKRLAELDASRGLQDPADIARRMRGETPAYDRDNPAKSTASSSPNALGDVELANSLRQQAQRMESEARGLLAESQRLMEQAQAMSGTPEPAPADTTVKVRKTRAKKTAITQ